MKHYLILAGIALVGTVVGVAVCGYVDAKKAPAAPAAS